MSVMKVRQKIFDVNIRQSYNNNIRKPQTNFLDTSLKNSRKYSQFCTKNLNLSSSFKSPLIKPSIALSMKTEASTYTNKIGRCLNQSSIGINQVQNRTIINQNQSLIQLQDTISTKIIYVNNYDEYRQTKIYVIKNLVNCFSKSILKFYNINLVQYEFLQPYIRMYLEQIQQKQEDYIRQMQSTKQSISIKDYKNMNELVSHLKQLEQDMKLQVICDIVGSLVIPQRQVIKIQIKNLLNQLNLLYRCKYYSTFTNKFSWLYSLNGQLIKSVFDINIRSPYLFASEVEILQPKLHIYFIGLLRDYKSNHKSKSNKKGETLTKIILKRSKQKYFLTRNHRFKSELTQISFVDKEKLGRMTRIFE